jgi:phage shock protein PspC (stress-responsive transcriptional regulator)
MNKVININFQGRILPIEEQAYENLKQYIASLQSYFANEEGRDEIINDIECRIAELCEDRLKKGAVCINENSIELIINSIGRPADFEAQDGFEQKTSTAADNNSSKSTFNNAFETTAPKRLYRDEQNKVLGGVCSGIANYLNLDPIIVRVLWILLFGISFLAYLLLWIAVPSSSEKEIGGVRKRLFRDIDHKVIGGVCAGLSKYFGVKVIVVRILFLIPSIVTTFNWDHFHLFQFWDFNDFPEFFGLTFFGPGALFVYIVMWLVLPEARTSADKLEMIGEKVDINNIKNAIQTDMEGFSKRAQAWGNTINKKQGTTSATNNENPMNETASNNVPLSKRKGCLYYFGRTITILLKAFVYFILGIITISILAALFGIGVAGTSLLPLRGFLLEDGLQSAAAIGTILFFVWVPVIGIVTAVIRKIAGFKKSNPWVRSGFISLWVLGWICIFYFGSSLGNSFSKHNVPAEQTVSLTNPKVDYLELTTAPLMKYYDDQHFNITPFSSYNNDDTIFIRNLKVRIVQSKTDSFVVNVVKLSNGKSVQAANQSANNIGFSVQQLDSLLYLDRGIAITKNNKFRNQHLIMTIAVPVGKRIKIANENWQQVNIKMQRNSIRRETINGIHDGWYDEWNEPWDGQSYSYEKGVEYKMTKEGLVKLKADTTLPNEDQEESPSNDAEKKLEELKKERLQMEELKAKENKKVTMATPSTKSYLLKKSSKLLDLQWVMDRFSY